MKRVLALILTLAAMLACCLTLSSCDLGQEISNIGNSIKEGSVYDYAIVSFPTGFTQRVELKSFLMDGQQNIVYLYGLDGKGYIVSPENCMLVNDPKLDINAKQTLFDTYKIDYEKVVIKSPDGEIIMIEKPGAESITSFMDLYVDTDGVRYFADERNTIVEFTYE